MKTTSQNSQIIQTSNLGRWAAVLKFRSYVALFQKLRRHLFSLSLLLWLSVLVALWRTLSSQLFEVFQSLPAIDQFFLITAVCLFCCGFAATVREFRTDFGERWAARIVGACGVLVLLAFSFWMTVRVDRLQNQLAGKEFSDSETSAVAHQISVVPAPKVYSVRTEGGIEISWNGADGGVRPLSTPDRRGCFDHGATFAIDRTSSTSGLRPGAVSAESPGPEPSAVSF